MAEFVALHVEHTIPELEQLKRLNLFTQEELAERKKKHKEFEYKIESSKKVKDDYESYIRYESKFLRTIKLRRDKFRIHEKKNEIEYAITKRIMKLYKMALLYFNSDYTLWMSYINFCTQTKFINAVSEAFKQMLQVHGDKIQLWRHAAKWEQEEMKNIEGALSILKLGLHHHPNSKELYTEAFTLELQSATVQKKKSSNGAPNEDEIEKQKKATLTAEVMFKSSLSKPIGEDVEFIISLLEIATKFKFTETLQKTIIEHLIKECYKSELMWHTMALRELQGHHYDANKDNQSPIKLCLRVYRSAIKVVPTALMWEKYLDTLFDLYGKKKSIKVPLESAFEEAFGLGFLLEKHYKMWVELNEENQEKQLEILIKATAALPQSACLWQSRIQLHIELNEEDNIWAIAREAISVLQKNALPIYKLLIQYNTLVKVNNFAEIKALFDEGIQADPAISLELRTLYLEWLCIAKNLMAARQEYDRLATMVPYSLEFHRCMLHLELNKTGAVSVNIVRNIYKLMCQQFGETRTDVWLDYMKFEMIHNPKNIPEIYNTAKSTLNENLVDTFISEYSLLKFNV